MNFEYADRVERIEPSATIAVSNRATALEAEGEDVVDLSVGEPDFPTPTPVVEAGKAAMDAGHTGYAPSRGVLALREAIVDDLQRRNLDYGPDEVVVTPGAKQALFEAIHALIDEGDEVVLIDPAWVSYEAMVKLAGGSLVRVDTSDYDFQLEPAMRDLDKVVTDATDMLIVCSPNNPTGAVYSDAALAGVRDLAVEHDVAVISDEIYDRVVYDDVDPRSLGSLDGMADRTITINGFSKSYAMTGWRLGYMAAPEELVDEAGKIQSHSVTCATNFVQHAGLAALETVDEEIDEMVEAFEGRRDLLVDLLADEGVGVPEPEGAFYLFLPVDDDDHEWCMDAIEEAHVATVPGSAFGTPGYARISYANSEERIREGVRRLADAGFL
jgi:aspartate aminotransferase